MSQVPFTWCLLFFFITSRYRSKLGARPPEDVEVYSEIKLSSLYRIPSSGMWRRVDLVWAEVSKERIASILRVEKSASEEPAWAWRRYLPPNRPLTQDLHGATSLKTAFFSHRRENLKSYISFEGTYRLHLQGRKISERGTSVSMKAIPSSETSAHTRSTWCHIPEDGILQPPPWTPQILHKFLIIFKMSHIYHLSSFVCWNNLVKISNCTHPEMWHTPILQGEEGISHFRLYVISWENQKGWHETTKCHRMKGLSFLLPASEMKCCTNVIAVSVSLKRWFGENCIFSRPFSKETTTLSGTNPLRCRLRFP
jgi:hypothetical protein